MIDWNTLLLTFRLAAITTVLLLIIAIPLAHWLAYSRSRLKPIIETLVSMPLVLPPTVLGFYLLVTFSPANPLGHWLSAVLGLRLVFSFEGLLLASVLYSLPFMVHPIQSGLASLPRSLIDAAANPYGTPDPLTEPSLTVATGEPLPALSRDELTTLTSEGTTLS